MLKTKGRAGALKTILLGATVLGASALSTGFALAAQAQDAGADKAKKDDSTVVVVTGYRASLQNATKAKKNATNFTESIFAEDMGKFPDLNMAEAMQRVPGMVVQRDALTGDGTQISVRALPASFTLVTMNDNRVAVASDFGFTGSSSPNREVDLDMFPTELFNRVDVSKTPSADTMEGGIAGTVNLQNARPFDRKGAHLSLSLQGSYNTNARDYSPRFSAVASKTWDKFGILAGFVSSKKKVFSDGFETIGWSDPNLSNFCTGCDPSLSFDSSGNPVNIGGSNGFKFSNTVYPYTGNGLTPGTTLSEADLLALNPGLTETQLKSAVLPRLGRNYLLDGDSKQNIGLISMEYRPNDDLRFTFDIFGGKAQRDAIRTDMMWVIRSTGANDGYNGGMIPLNMQVDSNNVVTSGTFANSAFLSETNHYVDDTGIASFNTGMNWKLTDTLTWDAELAYTHSTYERDVTFLKFTTPANTNITVDYKNDGGNDIPTINPNVNLNDPNLGWRTFQVLLQRDKRYVNAHSFHTNLTKELGEWRLKAGIAYDSYVRSIDVHDNSTNYSNAFKAAIPDSALGQYLVPMTVKNMMSGVSGTGYTSFIEPNFSKIEQATNYDTYLNANGSITTGTTYNGAGAGFIKERINNAFAVAYYDGSLFNVPVKSNFGLRYQKTDQTVTSPSSVNGQIIYLTTEHKYSDVLPSFNAVANVTDKFNLRVAASKTMTRANPSQMTSQLNYSDPGGQNASSGNPALKPYYSNNFDIGGEYYTGGAGYVGLTFFQKVISNYTTNVTSIVPFNSLGVNYTDTTSQQQTAIATQLGTTVAAITANPSLLNSFNINLTQPINASTKLKLNGEEFMWVQPLDFLLNGLGYSVNYTHFSYNNIALALGIPDDTYNLTAYYEKGPFSVHASYADVSRTPIGIMPSANNMAYNWYSAERHQIDLSAAYKFKLYGLDQSITLDAVNLDKQGYRNYYTLKNIPYSYNNPGSTIYIGWRAQY
ncbi:MAG: TonB-dependent receptor [Asticcacaulis sp.]|uniref:TonB-dependent receptor n=1 Tax=Asticcacaulis sp. TaxID=1872648 RepID=UPI003F7B4C72